MLFAEPHWLWALLLLPLGAAAESWATRRDRERTARFVARPLWVKVVLGPGEHWRFVRGALFLIGGAGIVLALARPQWGIVREKVEREGVDVVLVLDTSGSMATEDVQPNRFFVARAALQSLVQQLSGDRFALVAFEGEAYPLVPLTLDADAVGLFLETLETGIVPAPGSSLGAGLAKGLETFVDKDRRNKVMVLLSDGEDLEGDVDDVVRRAKDAGVIVHAVGVGTEQGQPVPDFDREGNRVGFKKDEGGSPVISRMHPDTLEAIARGTGGRFVRLSADGSNLHEVAAAIEGLEQRTLAREYSYRQKERFQVPLAIGLTATSLGLALPFPRLRRRRIKDLGQAAVVAGMLLVPTASVRADSSKVADEVLLRPKRLTAEGRKQYELGNHEGALKAFEGALAARPDDARARFNLGNGLYKNGKFDESAAIFRDLASHPRSPLAAPSRFNLGNSLFQKQDYPGAVQAFRNALQAAPGDEDARRNLELALRALQKQKQEQEQKQPDKDKKDDPRQDEQKQQAKPSAEQQRPKSEEEKEQERFQKEAGMPKERAMQLLDALQQNEKAEQKKLLRAKQASKKRGKDW